MIDFGNLWITMERKGVTEARLKAYGVTDNQLEALHANDSRNVSTRLVDLLCTVLRCSVTDVMESVTNE